MDCYLGGNTIVKYWDKNGRTELDYEFDLSDWNFVVDGIRCWCSNGHIFFCVVDILNQIGGIGTRWFVKRYLTGLGGDVLYCTNCSLSCVFKKVRNIKFIEEITREAQKIRAKMWNEALALKKGRWNGKPIFKCEWALKETPQNDADE